MSSDVLPKYEWGPPLHDWDAAIDLIAAEEAAVDVARDGWEAGAALAWVPAVTPPPVMAFPDAAQRVREAGQVFVDWSTFWHRDRSDAQWLFEPVIAAGRAHAIYARHKTGKSC